MPCYLGWQLKTGQVLNVYRPKRFRKSGVLQLYSLDSAPAECNRGAVPIRSNLLWIEDFASRPVFFSPPAFHRSTVGHPSLLLSYKTISIDAVTSSKWTSTIVARRCRSNGVILSNYIPIFHPTRSLLVKSRARIATRVLGTHRTRSGSRPICG